MRIAANIECLKMESLAQRKMAPTVIKRFEQKI